MNAIDIKNINKNYGTFSLNNINLKVPVGMITGLVGENGAGKTTLIKSILGLTLLDSGEIKILDQSLEETKDRIGIVFDDIYFNPAFTPAVLEKVMAHSFKNWDKNLYFSFLNEFELPENQKISTFSKGMKVKLQIAVALSHHPEILILDEVTSGLDPIFRDFILDLLLGFIQDETHSVFISSHNLEDLEKIADKIVIIDKGDVVLEEYIDDLRDKYRIFRGDKRDLESINPEEIISVIENDYSEYALIKTNVLSDELEIAKLEDIFKLLVKGEKL